jgi:3D (Asp-Asp-Asp) domain-containing protein
MFRRRFRVTAYCDQGLTAAGVPSGVGQCAAPADIPFGARIYIPELNRTFVVTDRTNKRFRHNTVDIFIPAREACLQFGCRQLVGEVTLPQQPHKYGNPAIVAALDVSEQIASFR